MSIVLENFDRDRDRADQQRAARLFELFWPNQAVQSACADRLAKSIRHAHRQADASWEVTMFADRIRLNVGQAEVLTLSSDKIQVLYDASFKRKANQRFSIDSKRSNRFYPAVPIASKCRSVAPADLRAVPETLWNRHESFIDAAAKAKRVSPFKKSFSDGVLTHIEILLGSALPRPSYLGASDENRMGADKPHIDAYLFQRQLEAFRAFVEGKSGVAFVSFASNPYTDNQEGYKYDIHRAGRGALAFQDWKQSDIGSSKIAKAVIEAIEIPNSNLVPWQRRFGKEARPHQPLFEAKNQQDQLLRVEECLFRLYRKEQDEQSFVELVGIFGKTYPLLAYLFFLKDRSRYLPIAPTFFDRAFKLLGADFKTSHRCSWNNYSIYIALICELKTMLAESLAAEVTLLDAHSFAWMLASQMERENKLADVQEYLSLTSSEREAIVKARIGQGRFRQSLIDYWTACAVTGCGETALLSASHIKPWAKSSLMERLSLYNGLLLSPALDACFDSGYVSFDDKGKILISERLTADDASALGIYPGMCIQRVEPEHKKYLAFHREHIFK